MQESVVVVLCFFMSYSSFRSCFVMFAVHFIYEVYIHIRIYIYIYKVFVVAAMGVRWSGLGRLAHLFAIMWWWWSSFDVDTARWTVCVPSELTCVLLVYEYILYMNDIWMMYMWCCVCVRLCVWGYMLSDEVDNDGLLIGWRGFLGCAQSKAHE